MTFSVVCYDSEEKKWGVGVASRFLSVGSVVPWAQAGVGCIATQSYANYTYGPDGLELLKSMDSQKTIETLTSRDDLRERRQVGAVDSTGKAFAFTGKECHDYAGHIVGKNYSVQGNILAGPSVLEAMAREIEKPGKLEDRILAALFAAEGQGGDKRGRQSASILIVSEKEPFEEGSDVYMDIRVEDSPDPLPELRRIMGIWLATFHETEYLKISEHETEIKEALSKTSFSTLDEWVDANNLDFKMRDGEIGFYAMRCLKGYYL